MLCGLGVPLLRSLWGAIRNRQLYILRMYCKVCISFNFSILFIIYTTYRKKKITRPYRKNKKIQFFFLIHTTYRKKKTTRIYRKKKLHDWTIFLYTTYIFHNPEGVPGCPLALGANETAALWRLGTTHSVPVAGDARRRHDH